MHHRLNTQKSSNAILKQIIYFIKPYKILVLGVIASLIITSLATLMISQSIKIFIDEGIAQQNMHSVHLAFVLLIFTIITLAFFTFCRFSLITFVGEKVVSDIRVAIFEKILSLSMVFFDKNKSGDLLSRLVADTTILLSVIGSSLSVAMRNIVMLIGGIIMLLSINLKLTMMLLVIIPVVIMPIFAVRKKLREYATISQDRVADLTSQTDQVLGAVKVVQSYCMEDFEMGKFQNLIQIQIIAAKKRIIIRGILTATVILLAFLGIGFVLWYGGIEVLHGNLSAGKLSAFIYVAVVCGGTVAAISDVMGEVQKAIGASQRIFEFFDTAPSVPESEDAISINKEDFCDITIQNASFSYQSNAKKRVLSDISFEIKKGTVNALVGKSGSGKTTIFMLLQRFYDVINGNILINNINIKNLKIQDLRRIFTYVPQDPYIFSTTIFENIAYGNPHATEAMVLDAAKKANCIEFIERFPDGIYSYLGDKGVKLSGGQRQRIAIARAILNDPKILLLDEATSALDSENEALIKDAINTLMYNRTTIIIAHRISTIKDADQIIVIDKGAIQKIGTHAELKKNHNSLYYKLCRAQHI